MVVVTVLEGCHLPLEASTWPGWWATMHHVWEAVLLGSMHLLLAFCFLLNAQELELLGYVASVGLLW